MQTSLSRLFRARHGNIAVAAALSAPLVIAGLAISVDYSALVKQRRSAQATVDLAAIAAAANPAQARLLLQQYYSDNGLSYAVQEGGSTYLPGGETVQSVPRMDTQGAPQCIATVETGHYEPDPALPVSERFQSDGSTTDAVRVRQQCRGNLYFGSSMMAAPVIEVSATAASKRLASFWIGTRLGSLDGGLANAVFGALFGTTVSLNVADYNALLDANIDVLSTVKALATNINMTAATYDQVLDADVTLAQFFRALRIGGNATASVQASLRAFELSTSRSNRTFKLSQILNLASIGKQKVGTGYGGASTTNALGLIRAAGAVSNGQHQVQFKLDYTLPAIGNVNFWFTIGEPPVGAQSVAIGAPGSLARTAQIRAMVTFTQGNLPALAGTTLRVPIYLEAANSEARLDAIQCGPGGPTSVKMETYPGLGELTIGDVDQNAFINFGSKPRVTPATLLSSPIVNVKGSAQVDVKSMAATLMTFSSMDIDQLKVKNTSVTTPFTSYMSSLIKNLNLDVSVFGVGISTSQITYRNAVVSALSTMSVPADQLLASFMYLMGIKIGEADVSVTGASCSSPSLVL
ncbi:MAG TPA: pilus assembly protein TadG-related protein [Ensifer sp.]|nr:pilus assembly protein TadG-related protein [Ensifer sp.]